MRPDLTEIENRFNPSDDGKFSSSKNGMVSSQSSYASQVGADILRSGGNAVDSAIAAAFALAVTEPQASGLGGQTMMLINYGGRVIAVDGSSRAPSLAHVSSIYKQDKSVGYRAATVPSTPATLWYIHNRYGSLKWQQVLDPAIALARNGYTITGLQETLLKRESEDFHRVESQSGIRYFFSQRDSLYGRRTVQAG